MLSSITPLGERGRSNRWVGHGRRLHRGLGVRWRAARRASSGRPDRCSRGRPMSRSRCSRLPRSPDSWSSSAQRGSRLPTNHRQVNERWLDEYRGWVYGLGYGFQLGLGVVTIVTSAATYLTFVAAFLCHSVLGGLAIGLTFGLVRALPVLLTAPVRTPAALRGLLRRNARWAKGRPPARSRWAGVRARGGNPCDDGDLMKLKAHGIEADLLARLGGPDQRPASAGHGRRGRPIAIEQRDTARADPSGRASRQLRPCPSSAATSAAARST